MKRLLNPDPKPLRRAAYSKRDGDSLRALWKTIEHLQTQGIDIGLDGEKELSERQQIKDRYKTR